ncbi:unnamed protein product, partial [Notodromas monacha]
TLIKSHRTGTVNHRKIEGKFQALCQLFEPVACDVVMLRYNLLGSLSEAFPSMGCCHSSRESIGSVSERKGTQKSRLSTEKIRWKSDVPLTFGQLVSKRDEFWDTAPVFEGRKEIWDALRAAASAFEAEDFDLAQAILDGANIMLPTGSLVECYDELGNRYQLPVYCLSHPLNLVKESLDSEDSLSDVAEPESSKADVFLCCRLSSTGKDDKLAVRLCDTIRIAKRRLQLQQGMEYEPSSQRWFYGGKLLSDSTTVEDCKIPAGHVIQVIVNLASPPQTMEMSCMGRRTTASLMSDNLERPATSPALDPMTQVEILGQRVFIYGIHIQLGVCGVLDMDLNVISFHGTGFNRVAERVAWKTFHITMFSIDADDERSQSIEGWDSEKSPLESLAEIKVAVESSEQYLKFLVEEKNKVEARVRNIENQLDENFVKGSEDLKNLLQSCLSFHSDFGFPSKVFRKQKEEFFRDLEEKRNELEKVVASPQPDVIALHSKWDELKREEAALLRKKATLEGETNEVKSLENCLQALTKQYAREKEAELLALNRFCCSNIKF